MHIVCPLSNNSVKYTHIMLELVLREPKLLFACGTGPNLKNFVQLGRTTVYH
jgi:hypothetical protein